MGKLIVCDTGTLLSIFLISKQLKGFLKLFKKDFKIIIPEEVNNELKEFQKHKDFLGNIAKEILKEKLEITKVKDNKLLILKDKISVSGKQRITDTDLKCFILSNEKKIPLFTDDFSVLIHLSSFFSDKDIFHGIALCTHILSRLLTKEEIYDYIFNQFIPVRFPKMTEKRLTDIKKIISGVI